MSKRIDLIHTIERKFNCELVFVNANLLHFKALSTVDPSDSAFEQILPKNVTRNCNILYERKTPVAGETMFVFAGMPNIPNYLVKTFGGINPRLNIWRLRNIAGHGVDLNGYRQEIAPTAEEVREHILTIYHLLNPNCKKKDTHKEKVELLHYREDETCWSCGSRYTSDFLRVEAPSYLHSGARVFLNTAKRCSASYGMTYEYYGKGLLKDEPNGDYAKLFALRPEAIYDWFYSKERSVEEVVAMFELIEHSYVARPYLYYCKGEYTKVRQIFLIEVIKFMNSRPDETVHLTRRMRVSIHALIEKRLVSLNDVRLHYFPF